MYFSMHERRIQIAALKKIEAWRGVIKGLLADRLFCILSSHEKRLKETLNSMILRQKL